MYPYRLVSQALRLGLLVTVLVLALSACGGDEKKAKAVPYQRTRKPCAPELTARRSSSPHSPSMSARDGQARRWKRLTSCTSRGEGRRGWYSRYPTGSTSLPRAVRQTWWSP